ncbi:M23 family peptidase [Pelatocladus sp. BLCC-F211]|uniref:M23 family peptidase n=1 Tax=Pelatocladus sp. BLCC-F211 TaxID=3342752 RepID=UPI0035B8D71A
MKTFRFLGLLFLPISLVILTSFSTWLSLPFAAQNPPTTDLPSRLLSVANNYQVLLPDWQRISFGTMPPIQKSGSINIDGFLKRWAAGDTPDKYLTLDDIEEALRPDLLSLNTIAKTVSNLELNTVALDAFPLVEKQTLQHLAEVVPNLGQTNTAQIPPIAALIQANTPKTDIYTPLSTLLAQNPALGKLKLNQIDLSSYTISDIPNIDAVQLSNFAGWQDTLISGVPGLNALPLTSFPIPLAELGNTVARIDFIWGKAEKRRQRTISGSDVAGFSVPCEGQNCPYIELDNLENLGRNVRGKFEGRSWISGKYQQVEGGWGCLKAMNGGKEPTGRLPYGSVFKVVVMEANEKTDTVDTALFFRFKNACGATPYFIGPVPFLTYKVNAPIFIGTLDSPQTRSISTPTSAKDVALVIPGASNTPTVKNTAQFNCQSGQFSQGVYLDKLSKSIAGIESSGGNYSAVGSYVCAEGGSNCGVSLGKYQFMSYNKYTQEQIVQVSGGQEFLTKLSQGYQPSDPEVFQFFPPTAQEAAFQNSIADKINLTSKEIDPTTGQNFSGERLIERVAQKHFGGDRSQVDSKAKDIFGRLSLKNYGEDVLKSYKQNFQGC